jgi:hypothetical protein
MNTCKIPESAPRTPPSYFPFFLGLFAISRGMPDPPSRDLTLTSPVHPHPELVVKTCEHVSGQACCGEGDLLPFHLRGEVHCLPGDSIVLRILKLFGRRKLAAKDYFVGVSKNQIGRKLFVPADRKSVKVIIEIDPLGELLRVAKLASWGCPENEPSRQFRRLLVFP